MSWKRLGKALLFPHIAIMIILVPISAALLVYSMVFVGTESTIAYVSYVLSAYTLTTWCVRIPELIKAVKRFKNNNKLAVRWFSDENLRVNTSLWFSLSLNLAFAILQLGLGFFHGSFWFYSLAAYYISLIVMRISLVRYLRGNVAGEKLIAEYKKYRVCGWIFLVMNLALSLMIFFMLYWNKTFEHHEVTTIAMAAFTFTSFTLAIINIVKYKNHTSPVYSASKAIALAAACVSMLTLTSTMLNTFGAGEQIQFRLIMLASIGGAVSVFIIVMALVMIIQSTKKIRKLKSEETTVGRE